jgi:SAM-dependent methyltransferase
MENVLNIQKSRYDVFDILEKNPQWNVVDLGCGAQGACPYANTLVDRNDYSSQFPDREFIINDLNQHPLPFKDHEFDFSFTSHILEHVKDPFLFLNEVSRVSKKGYIEIPTPLADNLVSGNDTHDPHGHKWWVFFNDHTSTIVIQPRRHIVHQTLGIHELNKLYPFFRKSFVTEIYWESSINVELGDETYFYENNSYDLSKDNIHPWKICSL